jgi:hypothetical protein
MLHQERPPLPRADEVANWLRHYPLSIASDIPERAALPSADQHHNWLENLKNSLETTRELRQLGQVVADAQKLERAKFLNKWESKLDPEGKGYFSFELPGSFIGMVKQVVSGLSTADLAGFDPTIPLSTELRFVYEPGLAKQLYSDKEVSKGQLHLFLNSLRRTVFNSKDPANKELPQVHRDLRKDIAAYGSPEVTANALKTGHRGIKLAEWWQNQAKLSQEKGQALDLVASFHKVVLELFAAEYFPHLKMNERQASQVRTQPERVFGAGAAAQLIRGPLHHVAELFYSHGTNQLNRVFAEAFLAYADDIQREGFPDQPRFIDALVVKAHELNSYSMLLNNILSAVAAGTDTTTQVLLETTMGVLSDQAVAQARREQIVFEFTGLKPALAAKIRARNWWALSEEDWKTLTNLASPKVGGESLATFVQATANASAPVALTFKETQEAGQGVTHLVPVGLVVRDKDQTAFGGEGDPSQCTGKSQALRTVAFFTLLNCFSEVMIKHPAREFQKKVGIVRTHSHYPVKFI